MKETAIKKLVYSSFKSKEFGFWFFLRVLSTSGPLLTTYIYSKGIYYLENQGTWAQIVRVFVYFVIVVIMENTLRLVSKARIAIVAEETLIKIQSQLIKQIDPIQENRKKVVQTIRNLTEALRGFIEFARNSGVAGVVSFFSVPIILFFIDKRVFALEITLILIYLSITKFFAKIYEKQYEKYDSAIENYFSRMLQNDNFVFLSKRVKKYVQQIQRTWAFGWITAQNIVALFKFMVIIIVSYEISHGGKQISDLVLIVGYTAQSQGFLNSITSAMENLMKVEAGIERVEVISKTAKSA